MCDRPPPPHTHVCYLLRAGWCWADCARIFGRLYLFGGNPTCDSSGAQACFNNTLASLHAYCVRAPDEDVAVDCL